LTLIENELGIIKIEDLMKLELKIPEYQRPYRWSEKSAITLFEDTYEAYKEKTKEYRLGTVILHRTKSSENEPAKYNIVDGQQRTTTLSILMYTLGNSSQFLLNEEFSQASQKSIKDNFAVLSRRANELTESGREDYKKYLENNCSVVKIVTDCEQEAFQFFDSQNSRGKALKPHDLLKSYHLREMSGESDQLKLKLISSWEDKRENDLESLFATYLYPIISWSRNANGLHYSSKKIQVFKGIKQSNIYNYAIYHKASNIFIEQANANDFKELLGSEELNQFQLTQPIVAGKRFFVWTLHYLELLNLVKKKIYDFHQNDEGTLPSEDTCKYNKQLYEAALLFFVDRFGLDAADDFVMYQLYTWCYSLRLVQDTVTKKGVNNYVLGNGKINTGKNLFSQISMMLTPQELKTEIMDNVEGFDKKNENYGKVRELIKKRNRW